MNPLMYTGICFAAAGVLTLIERNRMRSQAAARENDTRTVCSQSRPFPKGEVKELHFDVAVAFARAFS